jgi:hypothetical protein
MVRQVIPSDFFYRRKDIKLQTRFNPVLVKYPPESISHCHTNQIPIFVPES